MTGAAAPGPSPRRLLADVPRIMANPLTYLEHAVATWGDLVVFPVQPRPALLVNDPDAADQVLRRNAAGYSRQTLQYDSLAALTGQGLLTAPTPVWRERRRQLAPAFHRRTLESLIGTVDTAAARMSAALAGGPDSVEDAITAGTLDVVTGALFGADLGGGASRIADAVVSGLDAVLARATSPLHLPLRVPTPANVRLRRSISDLDTLVATLVDQRRDRDAAAGELPEAGDLLDLLLAHVGDPTAVRDEIVTLIVAGHETVASALIWAVWLLAGDAGVAEKVSAEAKAALGTGGAELADLARLPLTRAVLDETLRLYPPSWVVTRRAIADDVVGGLPVAAGTLIIVSPWTMHRRASWADAGEFRPWRFLASADDPEPGRRPDYLPFGAGARLCIGRDFALLEATVILARLAAGFDFGRLAGRAVRPRARVTVRPRRRLPLSVTPRCLSPHAEPVALR